MVWHISVFSFPLSTLATGRPHDDVLPYKAPVHNFNILALLHKCSGRAESRHAGRSLDRSGPFGCSSCLSLSSTIAATTAPKQPLVWCTNNLTRPPKPVDLKRSGRTMLIVQLSLAPGKIRHEFVYLKICALACQWPGGGGSRDVKASRSLAGCSRWCRQGSSSAELPSEEFHCIMYLQDFADKGWVPKAVDTCSASSVVTGRGRQSSALKMATKKDT